MLAECKGNIVTKQTRGVSVQSDICSSTQEGRFHTSSKKSKTIDFIERKC